MAVIVMVLASRSINATAPGVRFYCIVIGAIVCDTWCIACLDI